MTPAIRSVIGGNAPKDLASFLNSAIPYTLGVFAAIVTTFLQYRYLNHRHQLIEERSWSTVESKNVSLIRNSEGDSIILHQDEILQWFSIDPAECINFLRAHSALGLLPGKVIEQAIARTRKTDPERSLQIGLAIQDPRIRSKWITSALQCLANQFPEKAFSALGTIPIALRSDLGEDIALTWGQLNGKAAVQAFSHSNLFPHPFVQVARAFQSWSESEPSEAIAYATSGDLGNLRTSSVSFIPALLGELTYNETTTKGVVSALTQVTPNAPDYPEYNEFLINISGDWAKYDPSAAATWAEGLKSDIARSRAVWNVATQIANVDPALATKLADQNLGASARQRVYSVAASKMAETDPLGTLNWASGISDPFLQSATVKAATAAWIVSDPSSALTYLASQQPSPSNSSALLDTLSAMEPSNLAVALRSLDVEAARRLALLVREAPQTANRTAILNLLSL